jgi:hypothetical protein
LRCRCFFNSLIVCCLWFVVGISIPVRLRKVDFLIGNDDLWILGLKKPFAALAEKSSKSLKKTFGK